MSDKIRAALVRSILEQFRSYQWTVQGFGFARTKIADVGRIHVWDSRLATPLIGGSAMHTHPWPFRSTIISGELINQRFVRSENELGIPYLESKLKTGEGGSLVGEPKEVLLTLSACEFFTAEYSYEQAPDEIHRTIAQDGTVTLLERPQGPPLEEADTFWPRGTQWVSAEPRPAEPWQLEAAIAYALSRWSSSPKPARKKTGALLHDPHCSNKS